MPVSPRKNGGTPNQSKQTSIEDYLSTAGDGAWQQVKKRKIQNSPETPELQTLNLSNIKPNKAKNVTPISIKNRFSALENVNDKSEETSSQMNSHESQSSTGTEVHTNQMKNAAPPPVFIHGVVNYTAMVNQITKYVREKIVTKSMTNGAVKVNVTTVEDYRSLITNLRAKNLAFYTYQLKSERSFKVVIRNLHPSVDPDEIKSELVKEGYTVRNVINIRHWKSKLPLPLFFVDLEPDLNNQEIYKLKYLLHTRINVEAPRPKPVIVQCKRCQLYGHTKTYCTLPPSCVKCAGDHTTESCTKNREDKPRCSLCRGEHTANYRGCPSYKRAIKVYRPKDNKTITRKVATQETEQGQQQTNLTGQIQPTQKRSFRDVVTGNHNNTDVHPSSKNSQSDRLEVLIDKMLNQNAQILELLTKLLTKLI